MAQQDGITSMTTEQSKDRTIMTKPVRDDYDTEVEFRIALMAWRRWVLAQPDAQESQ